MASRETDFLNGVPELLVLRLLNQEPMYGYQLVRRIQSIQSDHLSFGEGCIYPILHRLQREQMLRSERRHVNGRTRVVYRVTKAGQRKLAQKVQRWNGIAEALTSLLGAGGHGPKGVVA